MKSTQPTFPVPMALLILALLNGWPCSGATLLVWQHSPNPTPPYGNWATAATNIQDAIDAARVGDEIVVTNGVYDTGGRVVHGTVTNRVAVTKPVTLRSVNGPAVTIIQGHRVYIASDPGNDIGVRCVYLTNGAVLAGFTLTNGCTRLINEDLGHRLWCISNVWCAPVGSFERSGGGVWCEPIGAVISNCVVTGNFAWEDGGGALGGTLIGCTLISNSTARFGGGASASVLKGCTLIGNSTSREGGGAFVSTLSDCVLRGNFSRDGGDGGGIARSECDRCTLAFNSADESEQSNMGTGGGAGFSALKNSLVVSNSAQLGGGTFRCTLLNCTITGNSAESGGGTYASWLTNCIAYYNTAMSGLGNYDLSDDLQIVGSCTTPLPVEGEEGIGNITNEPAFVDAQAGDYRLRPGSPCIDAGVNLSGIVSNDLDDNARPLDGNRDGFAAIEMGAYEFSGLYLTSITMLGNKVRLCWFDTLAGMQLQFTPSLSNPVWSNVPFAPGTGCIDLPLNSDGGFFRLVRP